MALLERVSTLVRANLNDLIDKAEEPEKMIKQVILDMQNQLAAGEDAGGDRHRRSAPAREKTERKRRKSCGMDAQGRTLGRQETGRPGARSLQRVESYRELSESFAQQVGDQKAQVENLKSALRQLEQKLTEAQAKADLLIAQHRRARAVGKASDARLAMGDGSKAAASTA